jgi:hypothetical protein
VIQSHRISILAPLAVGVIAQVCAIIIHLLPVRPRSTVFAAKKVWVMSAGPGLIWAFLRE